MRLTHLAVRGTKDWRDWLRNTAVSARTTKIGLIDIALAQFAQRHGWPGPPPRLGPHRDNNPTQSQDEVTQ